ncbi:MAG: tetratricopeptide repeat protein [Pseudomonadota bacterium]|nr:tetratricopeptide repeat protein [Pseudomonadota bacterium]
MTPAEEARWDAAAARHDEGMDLLASGAVADAAVAVDAALADLAELLGQDHPEVGHVRVSRGMIAVAAGQLEVARVDLEAGLAVLDAWEDDAGLPLRVRARVAYGDLLRQLGAYDDAVAVLRRARTEVEALDPDDPQVPIASNALGIALRFAGDYDASAEVYGRALASYTQDTPDDLAARATVLHNLAGLAHGRGDIAGGEACIREALALRARLADGGPGVALDLGLLATLLDQAGRTEEALATFEQAAAAIAAGFPPDHPEHGYLAHNRGDAFLGAGLLPDAEAAYRSAWALKAAALGAGHPEVALTQARLAHVLAASERHDEAVALATMARAAAREGLPAGHPFRETIEDIAAALNL